MLDIQTQIVAAQSLLSDIARQCSSGKECKFCVDGECLCTQNLWPAVDALKKMTKEIKDGL